MGVHNHCLRSEHWRDESFQGDLSTEVPQRERRNVGADGEGFELGHSDPKPPHCRPNQAIPKSAGLKPTLVQRPTLEVGPVERKKLVVPQLSTQPKEPASIFPKKTKSSRFVKTKPAIWEKGEGRVVGMNSTRVVMARSWLQQPSSTAWSP